MSIKVTEAHNTIPIEDVPSTLHLEIEIEGYRYVEGGLPIGWNKQDILDYINTHYAEILRKAKARAEDLPASRLRTELLDVEVSDLPTSQHLARIKMVDVNKARPITVTRTFLGEDYDVDCVVTELVKDQWLAGDIQLGDIVIIAYCEERPEQGIVIAKVFKSW